mmetsp:Transcript_59509/g.98039  ORF Transcript_59509/g.98039 Transcript_59509/m.98039 type:complete len:90 (-) Transcript_59509:347-616(-)
MSKSRLQKVEQQKDGSSLILHSKSMRGPKSLLSTRVGRLSPIKIFCKKMEKALQIKLRGKDIGEPLQKPKPKAESRPASAASSKGKGKK